MESFLNLNIWAGLLCPSIFLLLTTDNTIGKQTRIHLSAVHLTCVSLDYGRKLKHMQPEPNATNNCFKFLKSLVKVTANHRAKRTDMVHLIWVVWYKLCNLRPSEWVNWQVSLRTSRNIRGVFRDTKGVFCFESKHEGARRRENAIGGVGELRSSRKKKRAKHRQEERDRENWKWAEIKKKRASVREAVTENQLAAWILSSQWWFPGFVWEPFKISHNPWDWKDDGKRYSHFDAFSATRKRQDALNRWKNVDWRADFNSYRGPWEARAI